MKKLILLSILFIVGCDENIVAPDTTAPTVTITYPANGSTLTITDTIRVDVADESEISSVKFLIDGIEVYADSSAPYEYVWDVCVQATGNHTVLVKTEDGAGNQGQSDLLTFIIDANYDCEDVCGGDSALDNCGACDADTSNDNTTCEQDCLGVWGGDATANECEESEDVYGCIDSNAVNYSSNATVSDSTCEYSVYGYWMYDSLSAQLTQDGEIMEHTIYCGENALQEGNALVINTNENNQYVAWEFDGSFCGLNEIDLSNPLNTESGYYIIFGNSITFIRIDEYGNTEPQEASIEILNEDRLVISSWHTTDDETFEMTQYFHRIGVMLDIY